MVLVISTLMFINNMTILYYVIKSMIGGESMSILILAWPLVLIWLMSTGFFISLIIVSAKNIKSIDETMVDPLKRINNQPPEKMSPIVKGGLIFFALITLLFIFVNIFN